MMFKWLLVQRLNLSSSLTIFKSEFRDGKEGDYVPSAWDNRFIFNVSGTYNFPKNWSVGMKISCIGGSPYTPYDVEKSSLVDIMITIGIIQSVCRLLDSWISVLIKCFIGRNVCLVFILISRILRLVNFVSLMC